MPGRFGAEELIGECPGALRKGDQLFLSVHGQSGGLAHLDVIKGRLGAVEVDEMVETEGLVREDATFDILFHNIRHQVLGNLDVVRPEGGQPDRLVRGIHNHDLIQVWQAFNKVVVEPLDRGPFARRPLDVLKGADADGIGDGVVLVDAFRGHDRRTQRRPAQRGQDADRGLIHDEFDRVAVDHLDPIEPCQALGQDSAQSDDPFNVELDVLGGHLPPVVEFYALTQVKNPLLAVGRYVPGFGQGGFDGEVKIRLDQAVGEQLP